jgi:hypothetical protein
MFQTKFVEKIKIHTLFSVTLFPKSLAFCELMWKKKYGSAGQAKKWQCNTAHALCMLDNKDYRHTQNM